MPEAQHWRRAALIVGASLILAGCATISPDDAFEPVRVAVEERAGLETRWYTDTDSDLLVDSAVRDLLREPLTADAAVQVALLHNRRLQAEYEQLGIAQAHLVQAGLLRNPVFGFSPKWPLDGGQPNLSFSVGLDFLGVISIPLRRAVAASAFEAARARVAEAVLSHAAQTRRAFYEVQASAQRVEMMESVFQATDAANVAAERLRDAGNITRLELLQHRLLNEATARELDTERQRLAERRERLNTLMGVWGEQTAWSIEARLPDPPAELTEFGETDPADIEAAAVERSLALGAQRHELEAAARRTGLANLETVVPSLGLGAEIEREGDEWKAGPEIKMALPLLDTGQAARAAGMADVRRLQRLYLAQGVETRSAARTARDRMLSARRQTRHLATVEVPLSVELTHEAQLQYNAMQIGVFHLLQFKRQEIEAGLRYIDALEDYWRARATLDALMQGVSPHHIR